MTPNHQTVKKGSQPAGTSHLGDSPSCGLTLITSQYISCRSAWSGPVTTPRPSRHTFPLPEEEQP